MPPSACIYIYLSKTSPFATTNKIGVNPSVGTSRTGIFGSVRTVWQSKQFSPILFLEKTTRIYVNADRKTDETVAFLAECVQFYGNKTMTKSDGEDVSCRESSPSRRRNRIRTEPEAAAITFARADAMYTSIWSKEAWSKSSQIVNHLYIDLSNNPTSKAQLYIVLQILAIQGLDNVVEYQKGAKKIAN